MVDLLSSVMNLVARHGRRYPEEKLILFFSFSHDEGDESSSSSLVPNFEMALPAVSFSFYSGSCASLHGILAVETEAPPVVLQWGKEAVFIEYKGKLASIVGNPYGAVSSTNRAGEIIMAPSLLSVNLQPFYIFYYNVETKNIRRVRLLGMGDSEEFRRSYGFGEHAKAFVNIAHQHVESIAFFKDPLI
ncbi:unnamed protein product [Arabidopsis arenosa]|uniref:F-box associated beta-propeller type 3 domain-containing protein n=1 Tax=Arabidopsis arenosa TaxID=38785 RepID=A0A8S1ZRI0_ARAAE|nr:unnamed protein product [Arabidopsis arenosa]